MSVPSGPILPPPMTPDAPRGSLRAWVWHPRADVGPKLCTVLRVLKGRGIAVIRNDSGTGPPEIGVPVTWLFAPPEAEGIHV
jgi:hypothetical protein